MQKYIIFIGSLKKGGAERNAANLANHLINIGHEVNIVLLEEVIDFYVDPSINIIKINHKKYKNNLLNTLYVIIKLRLIINKIKPYRLIAMSRIGSLLASSVLYKGTVVRFDSYPLAFKRYKQLQFWVLFNMPWVKYIVCPSQEMREDVSKYIANKKKLVTIYNPVPLPLASTSNQDLNRISNPYFVVVARLHAQKRVANIIDTYYKYNLFDKANLMILGDGPEMQALQNKVKGLNLNGKVYFKGFVKNPYPFMSDAIALIQASVREGFPNVLIESLALGTPVIASEAKTGPKEIVKNGLNGFTFRVEDYTRLGELMRKIVDEPIIYNELIDNVHNGLERFSSEKVLSKWYKILVPTP